VEYQTIVTREESIDKDVNDEIAKGWAPLGGVCVSLGEDSRTVWITQAMTRSHQPNPVSKKLSLQPIEVVNLWNEFAEVFKLKAKIKVIPSLEKTIRARINEKDGFPTIEDWTSYFEAISRSSFLRGRNDRNWKASLEWAIKPKSIVSVIEGKYHDG